MPFGAIGESDLTPSLEEFSDRNEIFLDDVCRETGKLFDVVANEYYAIYLESVKDINNEQ